MKHLRKIILFLCTIFYLTVPLTLIDFKNSDNIISTYIIIAITIGTIITFFEIHSWYSSICCEIESIIRDTETKERKYDYLISFLKGKFNL